MAYKTSAGESPAKEDGVQIGETAPAFSLEDQNGKSVSLADYSGKIVVLEWFNENCPFVQKHYNGGHMNALAKRYADKDVVWLAINSTQSANNQSNRTAAEKWKIDRPILNDSAGKVGKAYGAKSTPGMFVIGKEGKVIYEGAIDDKADTNAESLATAKNYVAQALDEILAGKRVSEPFTNSYGCSIKY